tara:strand:- start:121 stop:294 length:174 start_codon:yes stop_codon:yes gene_type:complete
MFLFMTEHIVEWFKEVIGKKVDLRRLTAMCSGDRVMARRVAVRGLRELADDVESKRD